MKKILKTTFIFSFLLFLAVNIFLLTFNITKIRVKEKPAHSEPAIVRMKAMLLSVVKVTHIGKEEFDESAFSTSATGFSIAYDVTTDSSLVLTNDHFCNEITADSTLHIEDYSQKLIDWSEGNSDLRVMKTSPALDLCLIQARGFIKPVKLIDDLYFPQLFEKVYVIGAPAGDFPIILDTYISSFLDRDRISLSSLSTSGNKFIMISEEILPGHSGSPIFTLDGEVIGILFGALPQYGGFAASANDIKLFLEN
jgi:S1-C subfamily serine protease